MTKDAQVCLCVWVVGFRGGSVFKIVATPVTRVLDMNSHSNRGCCSVGPDGAHLTLIGWRFGCHGGLGFTAHGGAIKTDLVVQADKTIWLSTVAKGV